MPAVRGRRSGRGAEPSRGRGRHAPPPQAPMPRLAQIKLSGGLNGDDIKVSGKSLALALTGAVFFLGAGVAGAAWLGSSLFDAREAMTRAADSAAAHLGFGVDEIQVAALPNAPRLTQARAAEVRAMIVPPGRRSVLALDPESVRARVEQLDWVERARVRRLWPSDMLIEVERRQEFARWQEAPGRVVVIDLSGAPLRTESSDDHAHLPLITGRGANAAAAPILTALEGLPEVRARAVRVERVHDRRWTVAFASGVRVALPERDPAAALAQLETLHARYSLLDRPLAAIDMRVPGRLAVRVHPTLAGGLTPDVGGA